MKRLEDRVALITGGASGMGEASVRRFIAEGARVVLADIDTERGRGVAGEFGDACVFAQCDHTNPAENDAAVAMAVERFGKLDILFNNAGIPFATDGIDNVDDEVLQRIIDVDLIGPYRMTRAAMPALREGARDLAGGAAILYTSSLQGIAARPFVSPYTAAKHGVVGMAKSLALELARDNIRVNVLCPVATETPMLPQFMPKGLSEERKAAAQDIILKGIPLRRLAQSEDIANAALFLASDEASMITGIALPIDGGITAA
ncbi:MAG: SDR family oxidoreductase [Rhodospirillaceae bacterium]|jgi:NAD(P)-dependent dehydrogenase (short-subunit alcohol dehydrogenase family)|nr:SDR family oxidoreductase [Rhodospirillaceae bacterium]MBT4489142.1 SDR family oxidoreductase [Rhodospirillaceae bacterium]MBT5193418.1 SDR family oxidoreductase [Rhodospirillaceae bacterium]MBT5894844.1 SDR family oxidoreductase [Rhodospirillaceae bacterium]MBT6431410.1 SDR family oxidoreductase [Rhodospirillaceae bacterium]